MGRPLGTLRLKNASSVIIYQSFRINRRPFRFDGLIDIIIRMAYGKQVKKKTQHVTLQNFTENQ